MHRPPSNELTSLKHAGEKKNKSKTKPVKYDTHSALLHGYSVACR